MNTGYSIGEIIHHLRYGYRGVIFNIDESFQGTDEWYERNRTQPVREQRWYHVLVDGASHTTYVAEENLEPDSTRKPIKHPLLLKLFAVYHEGRYLNESVN